MGDVVGIGKGWGMCDVRCAGAMWEPIRSAMKPRDRRPMPESALAMATREESEGNV